MGLKINRKAETATKIVFFSLLGIILIILVKIYVWEIGYYRTKTVQTRNGEQLIITNLEDPDAPIETAPTKKEMNEHKVANVSPRYLTIGEKKARVVNIAVENNAMMLPDNIYDVNWYSATARPGQGKMIIMSGIISGLTAEGAFSALPELEKGKTITIENGEGKKFDYSVTDNTIIDRTDGKNALPTIQTGSRDKETLLLLALTKKNAESTGFDAIQIVQANLK